MFSWWTCQIVVDHVHMGLFLPSGYCCHDLRTIGYRQHTARWPSGTNSPCITATAHPEDSSHSLSPCPLVTTILLSASRSLTVLEPQIRGTMEYLAFCVWLTSFSITPSRFTHVVTKVWVSSACEAELWFQGTCTPPFPYLFICHWIFGLLYNLAIIVLQGTWEHTCLFAILISILFFWVHPEVDCWITC